MLRRPPIETARGEICRAGLIPRRWVVWEDFLAGLRSLPMAGRTNIRLCLRRLELCFRGLINQPDNLSMSELRTNLLCLQAPLVCIEPSFEGRPERLVITCIDAASASPG
jgi:hypothetical protein